MKTSTIQCILALAAVAGSFTDARGQTSATRADSRNTPAVAVEASKVKLPEPSGTFGVGRVGYEWIDASRPDAYSLDPVDPGAPHAPRALMLYLWYPAPRIAAGSSGVYLPGAKEMDADSAAQPLAKEEFGEVWTQIRNGDLKSHAREGAPAVQSPRKFPVVIFSHGLGGSGFEYTALIEELVSHGYVVVAIEHTYTGLAVVFPDGKVISQRRDATPAGISSEQRMQRMFASAGLAIKQGAEDVVFVLNKLAALDHAGNPEFPLGGRLDLTRVAAMGHSAGGAFATRACQLDARIRACISLDGALPPASAFPEFPDKKRFQQPVLLLEVDHAGDRMPYSPEQYADFLKIKDGELKLCPPGSYDVVLKAAGLFHGGFSDYPLLAANGRMAETEQALHNLRLTESFARAFLDQTLKGTAETLLRPGSQSVEATVKAYGN